MTESEILCEIPHAVLTKIHERGETPTRDRILTTCHEICANAASVTGSTIGAAGTGLLGLVLSPAEYLTVSGGVVFNAPARPDLNPTIPAGQSAAQIAERNRQHKELWKQYNLYKKVDAQLRNLWLSAADDTWFRALKHPIFGYSNRTTRELIQHLMDNYAIVDEDGRRHIEEAIRLPWEGGPLELNIANIDEKSTLLGDTGGVALTGRQKWLR